MIEDHYNPQERLNKVIDNGQLKITAILGIGAYGIVYAAEHVTTKKPYAVKCIIKANLDARQQKFQYSEINLHAKLSGHPNIIKLEKVIYSDDMIDMILEYCNEGDLFSIITEKGSYIGNDYLIKKVFIQIIDAVQYSHSNGIYHRDLKPENILVFDEGKTVKLADLGLATTEVCSNDFGCGSTFYMSPECQGGLYKKLKNYQTAPNDIWSLGIILINLTCGRNPWKQASLQDETFAAFIKNKDFLKKIFPISNELNDILLDIFTLESKNRISLCELRDRILNCTNFTITVNNNKYHDDEINKVIQEFEDEDECDSELEQDEELNIVGTSNNYYYDEEGKNDDDNMTLPSSSNSSDTACSWHSFKQISPKKSSYISQHYNDNDNKEDNNNDNDNNNDSCYYNGDYEADNNEYFYNDNEYNDDDYDLCSISTSSSSSLSTVANSRCNSNYKISLFSLTSYNNDIEI